MSRKLIVGSIIAVIIAVGLGFSYYVSQINVLPQSSYLLFDPIAPPVASDRIMVVAPHQDDETIGVGGYLLAAVKAGAAVEVVFATDGNSHGQKTTRHAEALKALSLLGVIAADIKFYDFPDGNLSKQTSFEPKLKADIDAFRPTKVFTTLSEDLNPDHADSGQVVTTIAAAEPSAFTAEFFLVHYHRYPRPIGDDARDSYLLPPPSLLAGSYEWQVSPLTAAQQEKKYQALLSYKSQLANTNPVLKQLVLSFDQKNELFATLSTP